MASTAALLSHLRRSRQFSSVLIFLPRVLTSHHPQPTMTPPLPTPPPSQSRAAPFALFSSRAYSTRFSGDRELEADSFPADSVDSELLKAIADSAAVSVGGDSEEANLISPVRAVMWLLDAYHDVSGFPWWITIVSSTLALRMALLFPLVLTLHKVKRIGEFFPKLPPPIAPPFSGRSYIRQFQLFQKERKVVGCPSYVWFVVPFVTQVPCFFLWMISIRKMSLDNHPGFSSGGALWFQNLAELSHGYSGYIFPFLVAVLHYANVQISFRKPVVEEARDIFDLLAKFYKRYLDFLTLPIAYIGLCIPQGSLLYWVTNSSLTLVQHFTLRHPTVLAKLGLQDKNSKKTPPEENSNSKIACLDSPGLPENSPAASTKETMCHENNPLDSPEKWHKLPIQEMSPKELVTLAVPFLNSNDQDSAIPLLKLALDKDPEYVRALVLMGQFLLQKQKNAEANEHFECVISKLSHDGHPTDGEDLDLLILSSNWAGIACERQGKKAEGYAHFERVANMEEPEDPTSKRYYFDGLVLLASTLYDAGHKAEAAKYLRLVVAYNPAYKKFLDQCMLEDDDIVTDLTNSRREL